jgi:outer membrane protein assembly factor BamB
MRASRAATCALVVAVLAAAVPAQAGAEALTFQADPQHSGFVERGGPQPPLRRRWSAPLGPLISYPVVGEGRVFVATILRTQESPIRIVALDARNGRTAWERTLGPVSEVGAASLAYDAGRLFLLRHDIDTDDPRNLLALSPADGRVLWASGPVAASGEVGPVAADGVVYVGGSSNGDGVSARRQEDGALLWEHDVQVLSETPTPSLSRDTVFVAADCPPFLSRIRRADGALLTPDVGNCDGAYGAPPIVAGDRVYMSNPVEAAGIYDAGNGARVGSLDSGAVRAVSPTVAVSLHADPPDVFPVVMPRRLAGLRPRDGRPMWRFRGDGYLDSTPLIVGQTVYVGSGSGRVYGVNARTGRVRWRGDAGAPVLGPGSGGLVPALAASDGLLLVPALGRLVAFGR